MASQPRKTAAVPLDQSLIAEARDLSIDVSHAAEEGIAQAIKAEKERRWRIENADAIRAANEYVEKHGLPLAKYRQF
ncbi:type II toxin-antitoxin system CcdA family antitoxin [Rhizobium sp. S95]|uniref:Type II toxin-antitoxin system CcdA family antitoxin n=1 Tax=Ciceribacter sichuanensis TaxID=2949647 RepID=A0AAJ1BX40_9HYPH|nr:MULTISPECIES: type II toxin-antitoxin system CcdA family antitoxin [unclassified Ciceribacter]MCM2397028.1 type II toxin-antitoxin system CcdA family antitoxin [Ciceribacter sp. S95]MCO5957880.1 type II toxin-antitoxin system CcdA family antitoxin [Ciceribacter sp. S101]